MTTLYQAIAAVRTAAGTPGAAPLWLDLFQNDWSIIGGTQDLTLAEDSVPATTTHPTNFIDLQTIWFEMPVWDDDVTFDDLESAIVLRVEAKVDSSPDVVIRLANAAETLVSNEVAVTDLSYTVQSLLTLVFPTANLPTGRTVLKLQARWDSDPGGGQSVFTRRLTRSAVALGDCEFLVRLV